MSLALSRIARWRKQVAPAYLAGFCFRDWILFLRRNQWRIDPPFIPRAAHATIRSLVTSAIKRFEDGTGLSGLNEGAWRKPVFLVGLPRSGTTHLFHLMSQDVRFGFPTRFDAFNPHTFLTLRKLGLHRVLARKPPVKRPMDNVRVGWLSPEEDNIALGILAGSGPRVEGAFPKHASYPERFRSFQERSEEERVAFRSALRLFTQKLVHAYDRPLVLKSPAHALCIEDILVVFPEARFVGIIRKPDTQFASLRHMHSVTSDENWATLQTSPEISDADLLARVDHHVRAYCQARAAIPAGKLFEIRYEDLVADEARTMSRVYAALDLPTPEHSGCSESKRPYVPNRHDPLDPALAVRLRKIYRPFYEAGLLSEALDP